MIRAECVPFLALLLGCSGSGSGEPRDPERVEERQRLADLLARRGIRDPAVLRAIREVPRHGFVPEAYASAAYDDEALPIGEGQTISQPFVVATMTEALALDRGAKVLEIGTGSGYQAAVLAELAGEVFTIEIVPELAVRARATLERLGYGRVHVRQGDGWEGWPSEAPFDAVIVTAAPDKIPEKLFEQLAAGGRMCIPVGESRQVQDLLLVRKNADGTRTIETLAPVRFVPMTGGEDRPR